MKIKPVFTFIGTWTRKWTTINGPVVALVVTLAGGYASYIAFHSLAPEKQPVLATKTNDTVIVKLVNVAGNLLKNDDSVKASKEAPVNRNNVQGKAPVDSPTYTNPGIGPAKRITNSDILPPSSTTGNNLISSSKIIILTCIIIAIIIFWVMYQLMPFFSYDLSLDKDPDDLTRLFNLYSTEIEGLGNPRKIKRFSNKTRFQYQYLFLKKQWDDDAMKILVIVLLVLEKSTAFFDTANTAALKNAMQDIAAFKPYFGAYIKEKGLKIKDPILLDYLFALNKDVFI